MLIKNPITTPCFLLALLDTVTSGPPSADSQSPKLHYLTRRALPQFSHFDGAEGATHKSRLEQAFKDMVEVVNGNDYGVLTSDERTFGSIYSKYFDDQYKDTIKQVFKNMVEPATQDPSTGADILSKINLDNNDEYGICEGVSAYTVSLRPDPPKIDELRMHFCSSSTKDTYKYPDLSDIDCNNLDDYVSWKMLSLGGYALVHELAHVYYVSHDPLDSQHIFLPDNYDQEVADFQYGPQGTRQLLRTNTIEDRPKKTAANADSFAWFANELYWSRRCKKKFGDPQNNIFFAPGVCPPQHPDDPGFDPGKADHMNCKLA